LSGGARALRPATARPARTEIDGVALGARHAHRKDLRDRARALRALGTRTDAHRRTVRGPRPDRVATDAAPTDAAAGIFARVRRGVDRVATPSGDLPPH